MKKAPPPRYTHGYYGTPTYKSWQAMKTRCTDPKRHNAASYITKGISYPAVWEKFEGFLADMGQRPHGTTLDRIDNSKGYSKANCRWATLSEQRQNRNTPGVSWGFGQVAQKKAAALIARLLDSSS